MTTAGPSQDPPAVRRWRWGQCAVWVVAIILLFGPVSGAIPGGTPPGLEGSFEDLVSVLLAVAALSALFGLAAAPVLGLVCSTAGLVIAADDLLRGQGVGLAELAIFATTLAASEVARRAAVPAPGSDAPTEDLPYSPIVAGMGRGGHQRLQRRATACVVAGSVLLCVGLVWIDYAETDADNLAAHGTPTTATVTREFSAGPFTVDDKSVNVTYLFDARAYRITVHLDDDSPHYSAGQQVTVFVDARHPSRVSLGDSDDLSSFDVTGQVLLLAAGVLLVWRGLRALRRLRGRPSLSDELTSLLRTFGWRRGSTGWP